MNYTATPDQTLGDQIHVNLTDDQGVIVFDQWHAQADWDADAGQTIAAQMVTTYELRQAPKEVAIAIDPKQAIAVQMTIEQASAITASPLPVQTEPPIMGPPVKLGGLQ